MYYLALNQQKAGPFTVDQLRDHLKDGTATRQTLFWQEGQTDWEPLEHLGALLDAPPAAAANPPSSAPEPAAAPAYNAPAPAYSAPAPDDQPSANPPPAEHPPAPQPAGHPAPNAYGQPGGPPYGQPGGQPAGYPPAPYGQPPGGYPPNAGYGYPAGPVLYRPPTPTSGAAVASAVCGGLSIFGCAIPVFGAILPLAAIICGHIALGNVRRAGGQLEGKGAAIAGLILGYLTLLVAAIVIIILLIALANSHY